MKPPAILARLGVLVLFLAASIGCGKEVQSQTEKVQRREALVTRIPAPKPVEELASTPEVLTDDSETFGSARSELGRGLLYNNDRVRRAPWSINLLKIDRSRRDLELATSLGGKGKVLGLSKLSKQIEALPSEVGQPLAAINGDFYRTENHRYAGDPRGLQIMHGELVSAPNGQTCFWIDADDEPRIGNVASKLKVIWPDGKTTPIGLNEERRSSRAVLYTPTLGSSTRTSGGVELVLVRHGDGHWLPLRAGLIYHAAVQEKRQGGNSRLSGDSMVLSLGPTLLAKVPEIMEGAVLRISTATAPDLTGVQVAIGGGPLLVSGGKT
jgi:hypothetical protein